jgi:hypothetical protein
MNSDSKRRLQAIGALTFAVVAVLAAATAIRTDGAGAAIAAAPQSTSAPHVSGRVQQSHTLTATTGGWNNSPSTFAYQWQQCDGSGANCNSISGATSKTYTVAAADVDHTLRVAVTAANSDGNATSSSQATGLVSSSSAPSNTASPTIGGTAKVGEQLTASPGTWTGGVQSFSYQWQRCDSNGNSCSAVQDATAKVYGVGSADVGGTLRVVVTATNLAGSSNASSASTAQVASDQAPAPVVRHNHAPTITYVGLRRVGHRVYARFDLCDDSSKAVTVIERDVMPGRLGYVRRFSVAPVPCGTHARSWMLIPRFQHGGRFTSTLRAVDKSGASSRAVHRTLFFSGAV